MLSWLILYWSPWNRWIAKGCLIFASSVHHYIIPTTLETHIVNSCIINHLSVFIICTRGHKVPDWSQIIHCSRWVLLQKVTELWKTAASAASTLDSQSPPPVFVPLLLLFFFIFACSWGFPTKMDTIVISFEETGLQLWNSQQYSCLAMFLCGKKKKSWRTKGLADFSLGGGE